MTLEVVPGSHEKDFPQRQDGWEQVSSLQDRFNRAEETLDEFKSELPSIKVDGAVADLVHDAYISEKLTEDGLGPVIDLALVTIAEEGNQPSTSMAINDAPPQLDNVLEHSIAGALSTLPPEKKAEIERELSGLGVEETTSLQEQAENSYEPEEVARDTAERLLLPMEERRGTEVVDRISGEVRRPCIEVYVEEADTVEIAASLEKQARGIDQLNSILDVIDSKRESVDENELYYYSTLDPTGNRSLYRDEPLRDMMYERNLSQDDIYRAVMDKLEKPDLFVNNDGVITLSSDVQRILTGLDSYGFSENYANLIKISGLQSSGVETEGHDAGGDISDLYLGSDDIELRIKLGERLNKYAPVGKNKRELSFTKRGLAKRVEACVDSIIPAGTEIFHSTRRFDDIIESGFIGSRWSAGMQGSTITGDHSNLLHFGEAGKINGHYGNVMVGIPIDKIVDQAPYLQQESMYEAGGQRAPGSFSQRLGRVEISLGGAEPLVVQRRIEELRKRHANVVAQGSKGDTNNLAFAKTQEVETAGQYSFSLGEDVSSLVFVDAGDNARLLKHHLDNAGYGEDWQTGHLRRVSPTKKSGGHIGIDAYGNIGLRTDEYNTGGKEQIPTDLSLPLPYGMQEGRLIGFAPISTDIIPWQEREMHDKVKDKFERRETIAQREEREGLEAKAAREQEMADMEAAQAAIEGLSVEDYRIKLREEYEASVKRKAAEAGISVEEYMTF